ncbi:MAG: enoyl-CoA hydratase/isomerase family protein [Deltaproteobacteria bacterium]|nr:enoyl-CoA hydratase/isomerase family protein [Candidatus Zymogenaceae bacterium]
MEYTTITFTTDGPIGLLTLNRPEKLNALNQPMIEELDHLLGMLSANRDIRVVILTGAGEKGFCSGLDMSEAAAQLFETTPDVIYYYQTRTSLLFYKMRRIPQPIIAAVHGAAAGAGFSFAMAADVRVVTPKARFNAAYINIGLGGADLCSSFFLPKLIGTGRAYEFLLTGDFMSAEEAKELGFVSRIVEKEKLMETAREIADKMVSKNPVGIWMTKEAINLNLDGASLEQALHLENRNQAFMITAMKVPKK